MGSGTLEACVLLALCSCTQSSLRSAPGGQGALSSLLGAIRETLARPELDVSAAAELQALMGRAEEESRAARTFAARSGEELKRKEAGVHRAHVAWRSKDMEAKRSSEVAEKRAADAARARLVAEKALGEAAVMEAEHLARERDMKDVKEETRRLMEQSRLADVELAELRLGVKDLRASSRLTATRGVQYANRVTSFGAIPLRAAGTKTNGFARSAAGKNRSEKSATSAPSIHHDSSARVAGREWHDDGSGPEDAGLLVDAAEDGNIEEGRGANKDSCEIVGDTPSDLEAVAKEAMSGAGGSSSKKSRRTKAAEVLAAPQEVAAVAVAPAVEESAVGEAVSEEGNDTAEEAGRTDKKHKSKKRKKSMGTESTSQFSISHAAAEVEPGVDEGEEGVNVHLYGEADGELRDAGIDQALRSPHSRDGRGQETVHMRDREWSIEAEAPAVEGGVDVIGEQGVRIEGRPKKRKHKKKKRPDEFT